MRPPTHKIAMWSGPRNLSTALMYSFAQHPDLSVIDEPFYAAFLALTGLDHPLRAEVLSAQPKTPEAVISGLPDASHYLKLMTHHMLPETPLDWASEYKHVFLIRHPARVLASYRVKREQVDLSDIGFAQQSEIYEEFGGIVIDSADIRDAPEAMLRALCHAIDLPFSPAMLSWPKGGNPADGVWAKHWYNAVHNSTGFAGPEGPLPEIESPILRDALPLYEAMRRERLTP